MNDNSLVSEQEATRCLNWHNFLIVILIVIFRLFLDGRSHILLWRKVHMLLLRKNWSSLHRHTIIFFLRVTWWFIIIWRILLFQRIIGKSGFAPFLRGRGAWRRLIFVFREVLAHVELGVVFFFYLGLDLFLGFFVLGGGRGGRGFESGWLLSLGFWR